MEGRPVHWHGAAFCVRLWYSCALSLAGPSILRAEGSARRSRIRLGPALRAPPLSASPTLSEHAPAGDDDGRPASGEG